MSMLVYFVHPFSDFWAQFGVKFGYPFWVPFLLPLLGPSISFCSQSQKRDQKWYPKWGPKMVPKTGTQIWPQIGPKNRKKGGRNRPALTSITQRNTQKSGPFWVCDKTARCCTKLKYESFQIIHGAYRTWKISSHKGASPMAMLLNKCFLTKCVIWGFKCMKS